MSVDAALGYEFQHWAARLIGVFGYWVNLGESGESNGLSLVTEEATINSLAIPIRLDVRMTDSRRPFFLVGEIKWTRKNVSKTLQIALEYAYRVDATHRVVVVGAPAEVLRKLSPASVLRTCQKYLQYIPDRHFEFVDAITGTAIFDLETAGQRTTVFLVAFNDSMVYEFAKVLAVRLTEFSPTGSRPVETPLALEALAQSVFDPLLRELLDIPIRNDDALNLKGALAKLPADRLLLDPWSYLAQAYLRHQSRRTPKRYRWVRLLQEALGRQCGNDPISRQLLLSERALAAKIPPLPLRCGRRSGREIISEFESASLADRDSPPRPVREIRLLTGTAGTGKSTLLEFIFNNHVDHLRRGSGAAPSTGLPIYIDLQRDSDFLKILHTLTSELSLPQRRAIVADVLNLLTGDDQGEVVFRVAERPGHDIQRRFTPLEALMLHYKLYLYVDGFDQLASGDNRLLAVLGREMQTLGYDMVFLVLASRPQYDELRAFDWEVTFPGAKVPTAQSILTLCPPERHDLEEYCQGWLDELAAILRAQKRLSAADEPANRQLRARYFLDEWLPSTTEAASAGGLKIAQDTRSSAIQNNPLLLAMALAIFMQRVGTEEFDSAMVLLTQADLFETLFRDLTNFHHSNSSRTGAFPGSSESALGETTWRRWFERCCFLSLVSPQKTVGRISIPSLKDEWIRVGINREFNLAELNQPFLQVEHGDGSTNEFVEFIHPAFHEFLAASFVARCLTEGQLPYYSVGLELLSLEEALVLRSADGILISPFGQALVALGRDSFKYLWGCLLRVSRHKPRFDDVSGLSRLAILIERDYATQQYLYDAGYVDRCLDELDFARPGVIHRSGGYDALRKLIGHTYYGRVDGLEQGIAELLHLAENVLRGPISVLDRWMAIFCLDHIENRLFRAREDEIKSCLRTIDHRSVILSCPLATWTKERWKGLTEDLSLFASFNINEASTLSHSTLEVPEPKWEIDSPFILRAAHYWGHVGNRVLIRQMKLPLDDLREDRAMALHAYARAVVYRLVGLFQTLRRNFEEDIEEAMDARIELPLWFHSWVRSGKSERTQYLMTSGGYRVASFERFLGPGQAIADTANQFSCRTNLLLWEVAFARDGADMKRQLDVAETEYRTSKRLWQLAKSDRVMGFQGESLIRYFLHLAGLETRMELSRQAVEGKKPWAKEEVRAEAHRRLTALERDYGMSYAIAWADVFESCEAFRQVLFRRS